MVIPTSNAPTGITQIIASLAQDSGIPFYHSPEPDPDWVPVQYASVGKHEIPLFNELTAFEQWCFESLRSKNSNDMVEMQFNRNNLLAVIRRHFELDNAEEAAMVLSNLTSAVTLKEQLEAQKEQFALMPANELNVAEVDRQLAMVAKSKALTKAYSDIANVEDFRLEHHEKLMAFFQRANTLMDAKTVNIIRATVFMRQRVDKDWDLMQTFTLRASQIGEIIDLIDREVMGGELIPAGDPGMGPKKSKKAANSRKPTGKESGQTLQAVS